MSEQIEKIKIKILPILKEEGVLRSSIFGSLARGEMTADSDIDILVDLPSGKSLLDLVELKLRLENSLQRKVDIITYRAISPLLKDIIYKEAIAIL